MQNPGRVSALQDLKAGAIAGSASIIIGHPLDTIKVQLQTSSSATISRSDILSNTNASSLFRGISAPLASIALVNALKFYSFGLSNQIWNEKFNGSKNSMYCSKNDHETKLVQNFFCGGVSGLVKSLVICPTELIKCRLQISNQLQLQHSTGPIPALSKILKTQGVRGLYHGWWASVCREVPGCAMYFTCYDYMKEKIRKSINSTDSNNKAPLWVASSLAGGISGCVTWAMVYPMDIIKTRIQTSGCLSLSCPSSEPAESTKIWYVGKELITKYGWRSLYRGSSITLLRAFPVNGIIFPTYEFVVMYL